MLQPLRSPLPPGGGGRGAQGPADEVSGADIGLRRGVCERWAPSWPVGKLSRHLLPQKAGGRGGGAKVGSRSPFQLQPRGSPGFAANSTLRWSGLSRGPCETPSPRAQPRPGPRPLQRERQADVRRTVGAVAGQAPGAGPPPAPGAPRSRGARPSAGAVLPPGGRSARRSQGAGAGKGWWPGQRGQGRGRGRAGPG